jgi:tartrate dehydratase alpha subunit/fumarate hydratase class I-like protein
VDDSQTLHELLKLADEDDTLEELNNKINAQFRLLEQQKCYIFKTLLENIRVDEDELIPVTDETGKQMILYREKNLLYSL